MKLSRSLIPLTCVCVFSLVTFGAATSAGSTAPAPALTPPCTAAMSTIPGCPDTGCGDQGDALLNEAKNRIDAVTNPMNPTLDQIRALPQPQTFDTGAPRNQIVAAGEGRAVRVMAFLLKAKAEGAESCNCGLTKRIDTDIHLVLVSSLPDLDDQDEVDQAEAGSVTAEITPRIRQHFHANWLFKNINDFEGEFVRFTGRLMLDTKHIPQAHLLPHERHNRGLKRATNWEIHPVMKFEVCNASVPQCRNGVGWKNIP